MPKLDLQNIPNQLGTGYPAEIQVASKYRLRQRLGNAGRPSDFGVNLTHPAPENWSAQRHWHSHEDEFVFVLEGEVVLINLAARCSNGRVWSRTAAPQTEHLQNFPRCERTQREIENSPLGS